MMQGPLFEEMDYTELVWWARTGLERMAFLQAIIDAQTGVIQVLDALVHDGPMPAAQVLH